MAGKKTQDSRFVILRSNMSGVWFGKLVSQTPQSRILTEARRCYSWEGALSCSGLALGGPSKGRICGAVSYVEIDRAPGDEMIDATEAAIAAFAKIPDAT